MEHILIISGSEQGTRLIQQFLQEQSLMTNFCISTGLEARRLLTEQKFDLVIVNAPLADEHGEAVARIAYKAGAAVLLIVKAEQANVVWERIHTTGIYLVIKPLRKAIFLQILQCIQVQEQRFQKVLEEKDRLRRQIQEASLLNRAKLLLMQVLKLSEPQAHRYIEKQAMDLRITKREVAEGIISTYEN